jgi:DNA repair protein RadA/Sms
VQALTDATRFAAPRRVAQGVDANRLSMLLAVMNRHSRLSPAEHDVYVNLVGGLTITETATDLPLALAIASSLKGEALDATLVAFGELGLTGEVRPVPYGEERLKELQKQGYTRAIVPQQNAPRQGVTGLKVQAVATLAEAIEAAFQRQ